MTCGNRRTLAGARVGRSDFPFFKWSFFRSISTRLHCSKLDSRVDVNLSQRIRDTVIEYQMLAKTRIPNRVSIH